MKIKSKLLSIMLIVFPLLITVGFSAWIIIYEFSFKPIYNSTTLPLSDYFDVEQSTTYNGSEQVPSPKDGTTIDLTGIAYKYKLETNSNYTVGKPINAGVYDVVISLDGYSDCQVKYTINKKKVRPANSTINLDYNSSYTSWDAFQTAIYGKVTYVDNNDVVASELSMANCFINGIHNGLYYYGTVDKQASYTLGTSIGTNMIIGSTYQANITMADNIKDNYEWINNRLIIKYKTAKVGSTYYTIEDAINNTSGTITFEGNLSNTSFVATSFCNLTKAEGSPYSSTTFNLSNRTLIVPYTNTTTDHEVNTNNTTSGNVYSSLIIPSTITLNVQSGSTLTAAAFIGGQTPKLTIACNRGIIINYGTIIVKSGGKVNAYGYIKGSGSLTLENGSSALDCMTNYDWPGGNAGRDMYNDVMPTNAWSLHNISCDTYIYAGATYSGYLHVTLSVSSVKNAFETTSVIIGTSSTTNCIFKIASGYIKKSTIKADAWADNHASAEALKTIVGSNQIAGQRDIIELYGTCEDGTLNVSISFLFITVDMKSSTSIPAPISFMDVYIKSGSKITLAKSDYMFLPGSKLVVEEGSELIIGSNVDISIVSMNDFSGVTGARTFTTNYCVDKVDAICIINGKLEVTGGLLGGLIQTTSEGAILNLGSVSGLESTFKSMNDTKSPYYFSKVCRVNGNINGENGNFEQKMYISSEVSTGVYGWNVSDNVTTFTLNFYDFDSKTLLQTTKIYVLNDASGNATYTVNGNEYAPTKLHYDFIGWSDSSGNILTTSLNNGSIVLSSTGTKEYSLYANWKEHVYSLAYTAGYKETEDSEFEEVTRDTDFLNVLDSFTISSFNSEGVLLIPTTAKYNNYKFYGWYVGISSQYIDKQIDSITVSQLETFVNSYGDTIPLFCYFSNIVTYEITFVDNNNEITDASVVNIVQGNTIPLPNDGNQEYTDYDNDTTKRTYFDGWYTDDTYQTKIDPSTNVESYDPDGDAKITLYGKWSSKQIIKFSYKNIDGNGLQTINEEKYLKIGQTLYMLEGIDFSISSTDIGSFNQDYQFSNWYLNGEVYNSSSYLVTESSATFIARYNIRHYSYIYFNISNASATIDGKTYSSTGSTHEVTFSNQTNVESATTPTNTVSITMSLSTSKRGIDITWDTGGTSYDKSESNKSSITYTMLGYSQLTLSGTCLVEGTMITLFDGTKKKVEDINQGDKLLVFNHEIGDYDVAEVLFNDSEPLKKYPIIRLEFSNNSVVRIVYEHGFFDYDLMKYVYIDSNNYSNYIGHRFVATKIIDDRREDTLVTLDNAYITEEYVKLYSPITNYHLNYYTEDILSMPGGIEGLFNIFDYTENLKYDEEKMNADIEKYGILEYEAFKGIVSYEMYASFPTKYFNVAIEKGILSWEKIMYYIERYGVFFQ